MSSRTRLGLAAASGRAADVPLSRQAARTQIAERGYLPLHPRDLPQEELFPGDGH